MPRAQATDPLHNFRFHCRATPVDGLGDDPLQPGGSGVGFVVTDTAEAGFQAASTPEYTVEAAEYREGLRTYTAKFPGIPTTNDVTLSRGVARFDTSFFRWITAAIEGREYRSDVTYFHAQRDGRSHPFNAREDFSNSRSKRYILRNAFPIRVKIAGDGDASTSDVSLSEMDIAYENFDVEIPPPPP